MPSALAADPAKAAKAYDLAVMAETMDWVYSALHERKKYVHYANLQGKSDAV